MTNEEQIKLYNHLSDVLPKFIKAKYPNEYDNIPDIVSDIFIKVVTKGNYDKAKDISGRKSYYTTICKNYIIDEIKKRHSKLKRETSYATTLGYATDDAVYEVDRDYKHHINQILKDFTRVELHIIINLYIKNKTKSDIRKFLQINKDKMNRYVNRIDAKLNKEILKNRVIVDFLLDNNINHNVL